MFIILEIINFKIKKKLINFSTLYSQMASKYTHKKERTIIVLFLFETNIILFYAEMKTKQYKNNN